MIKIKGTFCIMIKANKGVFPRRLTSKHAEFILQFRCLQQDTNLKTKHTNRLSAEVDLRLHSSSMAPDHQALCSSI
jgi:hypothetical protein